jgi:hypothetical protein
MVFILCDQLCFVSSVDWVTTMKEPTESDSQELSLKLIVPYYIILCTVVVRYPLVLKSDIPFIVRHSDVVYCEM